MEWRVRLRRDLDSALCASGLKLPAVQSAWTARPQPSVHVAILVEPFLEWILEGRKTVESRFSSHRIAPYGVVRQGDWIALKRSSGPVVGIFRAGEVLFFELDDRTRRKIRREYSAPLCAQDRGFWLDREHATFATLISVSEVHRLPPIWCDKRDRRGWVVLGDAQETQFVLPGSDWNLG